MYKLCWYWGVSNFKERQILKEVGPHPWICRGPIDWNSYQGQEEIVFFDYDSSESGYEELLKMFVVGSYLIQAKRIWFTSRRALQNTYQDYIFKDIRSFYKLRNQFRIEIMPPLA